MNVEIGAEAALFPEKEYINGIAVAVYNNRQKMRMQEICIAGPVSLWSPHYLTQRASWAKIVKEKKLIPCSFSAHISQTQNKLSTTGKMF